MTNKELKIRLRDIKQNLMESNTVAVLSADKEGMSFKTDKYFIIATELSEWREHEKEIKYKNKIF